MPTAAESTASPQRPAPRRPSLPHGDELLRLRNIGRSMRRDLAILGIHTIAQLARREPDELYLELRRRTRQRHDPCVWDVFAAAIHQARTGEALAWWRFTPERKRREAALTWPPVTSSLPDDGL